MASPFLYFADHRLSRAELTAACLDGDLVELGEGYIPADAVETSALRAASLLPVLGDTLAATHLTAAWIHGALPHAPSRHTVQRAVVRRIHVVPDRQLVYRDLAVPADQQWIIGGVRVTSVPRTLADLARVADDDHARAAHLLTETAPDAVPQAIAHLERGALPHKRAALVFLRGLAASGAQDDVTR
jgi:hypothetical protein